MSCRQAWNMFGENIVCNKSPWFWQQQEANKSYINKQVLHWLQHQFILQMLDRKSQLSRNDLLVSYAICNQIAKLMYNTLMQRECIFLLSYTSIHCMISQITITVLMINNSHITRMHSSSFTCGGTPWFS